MGEGSERGSDQSSGWQSLGLNLQTCLSVRFKVEPENKIYIAGTTFSPLARVHMLSQLKAASQFINRVKVST